jgi:glycosyltransferase involved in cell wall biosynthesis
MILKTMQYAARKVIAISEDVRSDLVGVSAITIHNSVDLNRFNNSNPVESSRKLLGLNLWDKTVTMVSRIDPIKGSYDFVKIAYLVKQSVPNVKFIIAGGALRDKEYFETIKGRIIKYLKLLEDRESVFESHIANYGLEKDFLLLGEISDIEQVYSASDVIVFPSYLRSISRAALEAAAAGIPSIATTTTWNNDVVVHGKTGFLVPQGDVQAAAAAISKILNDPGLRAEMGRNARRHALKFFDPVKNAEKIYALYDSIISQSGKIVDKNTCRKNNYL